MNNFRFTSNGQTFNIDPPLVFSGGELHVNINFLPNVVYDYTIKCRLQCSDDIMHLVMLKSALDTKYGGAPSTLCIPYMPYARQDRVCSQGDANSFHAFCQILGSLNFNKVITYDIHSSEALNTLDIACKNVYNITQTQIISTNTMLDNWLRIDEDLILVSPDKGATVKTRELADSYNKQVIQCLKQRDPSNGSLLNFTIKHEGSLEGKTCLIVDDICDGGGTFIGVANELLKLGCNDVRLFVTHGIFSKGLTVFDNIIKTIYTTDSFINDAKSTDLVEYINIHI